MKLRSNFVIMITKKATAQINNTFKLDIVETYREKKIMEYPVMVFKTPISKNWGRFVRKPLWINFFIKKEISFIDQ